MDVLFLGTAAAEGIPALFCRCKTCRNAEKLGGADLRSRSGFLVNRHLMIDITPDINLHKRLYGLDLAAIDTLCITHSHTDHLNITDLSFRDTKNYATIPGEKPLKVFANKKSCETIRHGLEFEFGVPKTPSLEIHEISAGMTVESGELKLAALNARHDQREDCLFYLVTEGEKTFIQMNDTAIPGKDFEPALEKALEGRKLWAVSMDCTCGKYSGGTGHMGIIENIPLKKRLLALGFADEKTKFFATHFSHNGKANHKDLVEKLKPHGISPAYDGMTLAL